MVFNDNESVLPYKSSFMALFTIFTYTNVKSALMAEKCANSTKFPALRDIKYCRVIFNL